MAVNLKQFTEAQYLTASAATYYTSSNCTSRVDNCTFTNTDILAIPVTVHIVPLAGSASAANMVISAKSLSAGECYTCPELVGKTIPSGTFVQALAG
ncbi:MAG: hypothetical protein IPI20_21085, partial [Rhodoferax sp.]|nr:hypothetical protein [Rhodoferax sp.]